MASLLMLCAKKKFPTVTMAALLMFMLTMMLSPQQDLDLGGVRVATARFVSRNAEAEAETDDAKKKEEEDSEASCAKERSAKSSGEEALRAFKREPEVGELLGSLIDGIKKAKLLDVDAARYDGSTLTLKTTTGDAIYGEIASKSRVPVAWKVQPTLTFEIEQRAAEGGETRVAVTGLGTHPSAQGLALYEAAMRAAATDPDLSVNPEACDGTDMGCIQEEMKAAGAYLMKKSGWSGYPNYDEIKEKKGKLGQVLKTTFGDRKIWMAVNIKGEWPKIFYSMITAAPLKITSFVFHGGKVYAESEPDPRADERYSRYHLVDKSNMMGEKSMKDARSTMTLAEGFARSGMAFAKMLAFGKDNIREEMEDIGLTAAKPDALQNLFAACQKDVEKMGDGETQNPQCTGKDKGRVWWGSSPGAAFTDTTARIAE